MKLTTKEKAFIEYLQANYGKVFEWHDILNVPNGAKHLTTISNRNLEMYRALASVGAIRRATPAEVDTRYAEWNVETSHMVRDLEQQVEHGYWERVESLAHSLAWRTGDGHPSRRAIVSRAWPPSNATPTRSAAACSCSARHRRDRLATRVSPRDRRPRCGRPNG